MSFKNHTNMTISFSGCHPPCHLETNGNLGRCLFFKFDYSEHFPFKKIIQSISRACRLAPGFSFRGAQGRLAKEHGLFHLFLDLWKYPLELSSTWISTGDGNLGEVEASAECELMSVVNRRCCNSKQDNVKTEQHDKLR